MYSFQRTQYASGGMITSLGISWALVMVVVVLQAGFLYQVASATKLHYVHWNTSNPIFRIDNTDHIIDVNKGNVQFEYDQVNIICPVYSEDAREEDAEKYIIYNVSKEEYDSCRITNPSPRIIAVCDQPYKLMYFTITFRSFTPQPGGLEFKPGQDYYFISTSSRNDLHQRIGGRCSTHHMKVVFKVCCDPASQPAKDQANNPHHLPPSSAISTPRGSSTASTVAKSSSVSTTPKSSSTTTTLTTTTTLKSTTPRKTPSRKRYGYGTRTNSSGRNKPDKKHQPPPNKSEAVKNELSTYSRGHSSLVFASKRWYLRLWNSLALLSVLLSSGAIFL